MEILATGSSIKDEKDNSYILDEIIGQGGFGYVFKAHRKEDGIIFAVKTMIPSFTDPSYILAFKNEIQSAAKISGDNVIQYEFVNDGDTFPDLPPYIIMEYADGGALSSVLHKRVISGDHFTNEELINIFKQLSNGMQQINSTLVHRDIKPDNILLCGDNLKISDFGISKVAAETTRTMSFKGAGSYPYMAPEAWDYSKNTIQMDIYSMGIVFYELATLKYPYLPKPQTNEEYKDAHLISAITNPAKLNPQLSSSVVSIINRMLEKSIKKRFTNWDEIIQLLDNQIQPISPIDDFVEQAILSKNAEDTARQEHEATVKKKQKEREEHVKLIYSQFEHTIIEPIVEFAEKVNSNYAGKDKLMYSAKQFIDPSNTEFNWTLFVSSNNKIRIDFEVIFEENFVHTEIKRENPYLTISQTHGHVPQYKGKRILAWASIINSFNFGFNIILVDNENIYGDWIIMNNHNSFSYGAPNKERREPFAFSIKELVKEIDAVQITHLYSADFEELNETSLIKAIKMLSFDLIPKSLE